MKWYKIFDHTGNEMFVNTVRSVEVNNKRICLARLSEGYFAIDDKCPHAGGRLGFGKCDEDGCVVCPSHRYRFDVRTGKGKQGDFVNSYPLEIRDDGMYIGFRKKWWELF